MATTPIEYTRRLTAEEIAGQKANAETTPVDNQADTQTVTTAPAVQTPPAQTQPQVPVAPRQQAPASVPMGFHTSRSAMPNGYSATRPTVQPDTISTQYPNPATEPQQAGKPIQASPEINVERPYQSAQYTYGQDKTGADAAQLFGPDEYEQQGTTDAPATTSTKPVTTAVSGTTTQNYEPGPDETVTSKGPQTASTAGPDEAVSGADSKANVPYQPGPDETVTATTTGTSAQEQLGPDEYGNTTGSTTGTTTGTSKQYDWSKYGNVNWSANGGDFLKNVNDANVPIADAIRYYNQYQADNGGKPLDWWQMYSTVSRYDPTRSLREQQEEDRKRKSQDQWEKIGNLLIHAGNFLGTTKGAPSMQLESGQELTKRQQEAKDKVEAIRQASGQRFLNEMQQQRAADLKQKQAEQKAYLDGQKAVFQQKNLALKEQLAQAKIANDTAKVSLIESQIDKNNKQIEYFDQQIQYYGPLAENLMQTRTMNAKSNQKKADAQMIQANNGTLNAKTNASKAEGDTSGEHKETTTGYDDDGHKVTTTVTKTNAQIEREEAVKKRKEQEAAAAKKKADAAAKQKQASKQKQTPKKTTTTATKTHKNVRGLGWGKK